MKASLFLALLSLAAWLPAQKPAPAAVTAGNEIFALTKVHRIRVSISAAEWAVLQTSGGRVGTTPGGSDYRLDDGRLVHVGSGFGSYFPWAHADMRIDDAGGKKEFKDVGIRYKGNLSFSRSTAAAPLFANFKLKIDLHGATGAWDGEKTFNLHAGVVDTSHMRDAVAFSIFRAAGVPAPRTTYAELIFSVPGVYQDTSAGIFTIIEDVNKKFLERTLPPGTGLLLKPEGLGGGVHSLGDTWAAYAAKLRPDREATPHEQQRVMEFSTLVSKNDAALFREKVRSYLDVDEFLRFVAVNAFIANTDSYLTGGHNFYMYLDPRDDKFRFIPWDEDLSLAARPFGGEIRVVRVDGNVMNAMTFNGVTVANGVTMTNGAAPPVPAPASNVSGLDMLRPANANQLLITQLLADPAIAAEYRAIIQDLSATAFAPAELTKLMDALEAVKAGAGPSPRAFLEGRAAAIQQLVAGWVK